MIQKYDSAHPDLLISPSILSADFSDLATDLDRIRDDADWVHVDVMDGQFVPNITIGPPVVRALRKRTVLPLDVHLMIEEPGRFIDAFADAGADLITVHAEACRHLDRVLQQIRNRGISVGVSLNPATPISVLDEVMGSVDLVLLMTVNPGFGGQSYISTMTDKIRRLRERCDHDGLAVHIQVDGGISSGNIAEVVSAGADVIVAGSSVYGADQPAEAIRELRRCVR